MPSALQPVFQGENVYFMNRKIKLTGNWDSRRTEKSESFEIVTVPVQIEEYHSDAPLESETIEEYVKFIHLQGKHSMQYLTLYYSGLGPLGTLVEEYLTDPQQNSIATLQLVVPLRKGFGARGNAFRDQLDVYKPQLRYLDHSEFAKEYLPPTKQATASLADIIPFSVCTIVSQPSLTNNSDIQLDLRKILSFPWLLQEQPQWKVCALVHGRDAIEAFRPIAETAHDLGIKLIVLDRPSHWLLTDPKYKTLYEEFGPIDMTIDEDFPGRIAKAVQAVATRRGHIDGICTVSDRCLLPVAKAATALNLPTEPPHAFATAIDKAASRQLCADEGISFLAVQHRAEIKARLKDGTFHAQYPLIVKPSTGWSSEHVFRVKNEEELCLAAERVATRRNTKILIEPFVDGPEVDANFVLCDGDLLFFETSDDFPSPADGPGAGMDSNFFENANVLPSGLPQVEVDLIRTRLHQLLLNVGFRTGVFHLEARIMDSSMEYAEDEAGILDLRPRLPSTGEKSSNGSSNAKCFLIEINPRPPGFPCVYSTRLTYGIDYFALHLLGAIGDKARIRGLGHSFWDRVPVFSPSAEGGRLWSSIAFIATDKAGGICDSEDPVEDLLTRCPSLRPPPCDTGTIGVFGFLLGAVEVIA
ncbi:ATP-grasp domain-containing protein [Penicillium bovifimosum]|uniref:ATP-grasp domain-containing protein n=1 Tax=Penicillium bovifimosum TaxID=126998 RepID=A0A9W9H5F2_9EURO|nr:ATP-grasp domain-containing protein [Penicillium bovifimosum]KAJ5138903.1 ATP-grasp domain-containing protein [Penicillium bovifimosum]